MADAEHVRTQPVQIRITPSSKRMIERAAALQNTTVSGFVVDSALNAASRLIREHERLVLESRDWDVVLDALLNPPEPSPALRDAVETHARLVGNDENQ